MSDADYIKNNYDRLGTEDLKRLLYLFHEEMDKYSSRVEHSGIGTYLYLNKMPEHLIFKIRKFIESNIK